MCYIHDTSEFTFYIQEVYLIVLLPQLLRASKIFQCMYNTRNVILYPEKYISAEYKFSVGVGGGGGGLTNKLAEVIPI